jgi:hypothetical protein
MLISKPCLVSKLNSQCNFATTGDKLYYSHVVLKEISSRVEFKLYKIEGNRFLILLYNDIVQCKHNKTQNALVFRKRHNLVTGGFFVLFLI